MKVTTKTNSISIIIELSESEAIEFAHHCEGLDSALGYRFGAHQMYSHWARDINNAVSKARGESR